MTPPRETKTRTNLFVLPSKRSIGDRTAEKKRLRRQIIMETILNRGPISRAEIARQLEFNPQTVKLVVPELIEDGLIIEEQEEPQGQMGRPASPCRINSEAASVLGLAERHGVCHARLLNLAGKTLATGEETAPEFTNPAARAAWFAKTAHSLLQTTGSLPPLAGAALALDETITTEAQTHPGVSVPVMGTQAHLIRRELEQSLGVPVLVDNTSRMLALASRWFGISREWRSFVFLDLGGHFRVTAVLNGRIIRGNTGFAGNIGQAPLMVADSSSEGPVSRRFDEFLTTEGFHNLAKEMGVKGEAGRLAERAREKDDKARDVFEAYARQLTVPVSLLINVFNPEAIIIGGEMARHADVFFHSTQDQLFQMLPHEVLARTEMLVDPRTFEHGAEALGAAATVFDHIFSASYSDIMDVI